jgi:hypothetical protein
MSECTLTGSFASGYGINCGFVSPDAIILHYTIKNIDSWQKGF